MTRHPLTLRLADETGRTLWAETAPLSWSSAGTTQTLAQGSKEQFFGGGMQNGRFSHRDTTIGISRDYNWNEGGNPNAAPFYLSSNGYGVLRNTFASGDYTFAIPVRTTHEEQRFDAYYFVGDAREVIDGYTELTGRPAMLPMYALEFGDADCYLHNANRGERETLRDATAIAQGYTDHEMPLGWMLVNDGYGCGYEDLPETGGMLAGHGSELGLWTESDLTNQAYEVQSGVRVRKSDVAWVGPGYRFALDACEKSRDGIEQNSNDRATVLTIEGWAGTQRCAVTWSGDQSGSWDYIRWQIPTYAGATLSGQHAATGDVDGIFGGSAETYVRDLQWKMLLPGTYERRVVGVDVEGGVDQMGVSQVTAGDRGYPRAVGLLADVQAEQVTAEANLRRLPGRRTMSPDEIRHIVETLRDIKPCSATPTLSTRP